MVFCIPLFCWALRTRFFLNWAPLVRRSPPGLACVLCAPEWRFVRNLWPVAPEERFLFIRSRFFESFSWASGSIRFRGDDCPFSYKVVPPLVEFNFFYFKGFFVEQNRLRFASEIQVVYQKRDSRPPFSLPAIGSFLFYELGFL